MKNPITEINLVLRSLKLLLLWLIHVGTTRVVYPRAAFNASLVLSLPLLHEVGSKSPALSIIVTNTISSASFRHTGQSSGNCIFDNLTLIVDKSCSFFGYLFRWHDNDLDTGHRPISLGVYCIECVKGHQVGEFALSDL